MTPIQKAKEIALSHMVFFMNADENLSYADSVDRWVETPEAAALLSGEDWISVDDRLPEMNGEDFTIDVLALGKDGKMTVSSLYKSYDKIIGYGRDQCGFNQNVTHWQPLPEPTKP